MLQKILYIILITQLFLMTNGAEAFFDRDCEKALIEQIKSAKSEIKVAIFSFTRFKIAKALIEAKNRGVEVKVILDESQVNSEETGIKIVEVLQKNMVEVLLFKNEVKMHHKFIVIDKEMVTTGSFNFSTTASQFNHENLLIVKEKVIAEKFLKAWEEIAEGIKTAPK